MANASKKTKKNAAKKETGKGVAIDVPQIPVIEIPIKITIQIEVQQDVAETIKPAARKAAGLRGVPEASEPSSNFEYFITANGVTVERLSIAGTAISDPGETGKVFAPVDIETIQVIVDATKVNPVGSGSLQLKFFGSDLFPVPEPFTFRDSGGGGLNLDAVRLPL